MHRSSSVSTYYWLRNHRENDLLSSRMQNDWAKCLHLIIRQAISMMHVKTKHDHGELLSKIAEQRAALHRVHSTTKHISDRLDSIEATSQVRVDAMRSSSEATQTSIITMYSLIEQIMSFVSGFPRDIRNLLHIITQGDWRTYQAVLQIQERLAHSPSSAGGSHIQFTNALGEYRELPYEFFCHWEVRCS